MKKYMLEDAKEFERLEKQSQNKTYDYEAELTRFSPKSNGVLLDAGCGSGIVTRYLSHQYPQSKVTGCDFSEQRVEQARNYAHSIHGKQLTQVNFEVQNLTKLNFKPSHFDGLICRYVLEHMSNEDALQALREFHRCMRPNAKLCIIDFDGLIYNLFPRTKFLEDAFNEIQKIKGFDLNIGRKLPHLIETAGFSNVQWKITTFAFQGNELLEEMQIIKERFDLVMPVLISILGNEQKADQFVEEYLRTLQEPGAVLFYNKFIINAEKSGFKIQE